MWTKYSLSCFALAVSTFFALSAAPASAQDADCPLTEVQLAMALEAVVAAGDSSGLGNNMWATVVNRDGVVCAVARSGNVGEQWSASRVSSAQKAYTAHGYSLPAGVGSGIAFSSGNLYGTALEQGSFLGIEFSNPVDTKQAYGNPSKFGTNADSMVGKIVGGISVLGGGLALYESGGALIGGLGVDGDTSCTDHVVAWKVRDALDLDFVPGGVSVTGDDNLIIANPVLPGSFQHPDCGGGVAGIIADLPTSYPIGN